MRELIRAKRTTQHALNVGKNTLKLARQMKHADNKTRFKTTGKLLGLITLGLSKWFVREMWKQSKNIDLTHDGEIPLMNVPRGGQNESGQFETSIETFKAK
jgi:hypothetical protein